MTLPYTTRVRSVRKLQMLHSMLVCLVFECHHSSHQTLQSFEQFMVAVPPEPFTCCHRRMSLTGDTRR